MAFLLKILKVGPSNLVPDAKEADVSSLPSPNQPLENKKLISARQSQPLPQVLQISGQRFTLFSNLPVELQQTIWDFACQDEELEQRVLPIAPNHHDWELSPRPSEWYHPAIVVDKSMATCLKPALLHACHYTREKMLKIYVAWPCATRMNFKKDGRIIFVKPKTDIFYLSEDNYMSFWFLDIIRLRDRNNTMPGVRTAAQSEHANVVHPIACFAMSSQLYRTYFANLHRWRPTFPNVDQLTIFHGFPAALRQITAGPVLARWSSVTGSGFGVFSGVSSRGDLRKRLGIVEYADQREINRQADLVKPLKFMFLQRQTLVR